MFASVLDWIWMALAIAVGVSCAKYVPMIVSKLAGLIAAGAEKAKAGGSGGTDV